MAWGLPWKTARGNTRGWLSQHRHDHSAPRLRPGFCFGLYCIYLPCTALLLSYPSPALTIPPDPGNTLYANLADTTYVTAARTGLSQQRTRLVLESAKPLRYQFIKQPDQLILKLENTTLNETLHSLTESIDRDHPYLRAIRIALTNDNSVSLGIPLKTHAQPHVFMLKPDQQHGHRLVLDVYPMAVANSQKPGLQNIASSSRAASAHANDKAAPKPAATPQPAITTAALKPRPSWQLKATPKGLQQHWLEVTINGQMQGTVLVLEDRQQRLAVTAETLHDWRLRVPQGADFSFENQQYYVLNGLTGLSYTIDHSRQSVIIEAPANLFVSTVQAGAKTIRPQPTPSSFGGFINYDTTLFHSDNDAQFSGLLDGGIFNRWGVLTAAMLANDIGGTAQRFTRLETTWTSDFPNRLASLRLGDTISSDTVWARSVRLGGVQWATNFATQPLLITFPRPELSGEAVLPSTLELYVNNVLRARNEVPSGPFTLQDLPVVTGGGQARLVVRDLLGREQVVQLPYYASARLLQPGLQEYAYEVGFIRENFGLHSNDYGRFAAVGTHAFGLSQQTTLQAHGELLENQQTLGLDGTFLWPRFGLFSVSIAGSDSDRGTGGLAGVSYEYLGTRFSFGANSQWATRDFTQLGLDQDELAPVQNLRAFASLSFGEYGSLNMNYSRQRFRDRDEVEILGASYNTTIDHVGFISLSAFHVFGEESDTVLSLNFTVPLGRRTTASIRVEHEDGHTQPLAQVQRSLPIGPGYGYRLLAGRNNHSDRFEAGASLRTNTGTYSADVSRFLGATSVRGNATGGLAWLDGDVFLSRRINDSFAVVDVGDYENVRVYADNQEVARTNAQGRALVPRLRAYENNTLRIEQADLPLDAIFETAQMNVVPYFRSGLVVAFPLDQVQAALVTVVQENGAALPSSATVQIIGQDETYPVGLNGAIYPTKLKADNRLRATWPGHACEFDLAYTETNDPLPHLGPIVCIGVEP